MDPLPPKGGALDRVLSATLLAAAEATDLNGAASRRARATASALIRRAESLARVAPLAARHVSAVVALDQLVRSELNSDASESRALDAENSDALASASSALRATVLGDATPFGPAIGDAALARASKDVRVGFARRVIATCPACSPSVLALAGGWLVAEMRAGAARGGGGGGGDDVASRAVFSAALETIRNAGWAPRRGDDDSRSREACGGGWYGEFADATRFGFATRERVALCLLAFHGASKEARVEALADAAAAAAGKDDRRDPSAPPRRPRGGTLARAARAHAACVFAHCARHFDAPPAWLETRARNVMRGDGVDSFAAATALDAALDACLFEADETVRLESESLDAPRGGAEYVPAAAASGLPNELVASVRAAALALAEDTASDSSEANLAAVSARARRAAWDALRALPSPEAPETRTPETLIDAAVEASTSASDPGVGSFAFAWRCASRCPDFTTRSGIGSGRRRRAPTRSRGCASRPRAS